MKKEKLFTFSDLCAGIGGFRLGLEAIGGKCIYSSEIDSECEKTYQSNFSEKFDFHDVTEIVPESFPYSDILCAGFPCQPFSIAGKRHGFDDSRGNIFFSLAELIKKSQPKVIFLENVVNLLKMNKGHEFNIILSTLNSIGYNVYYKVLDSSKFGVPQVRKRLYIVGVNKEIKMDNFKFTQQKTEEVSFRSVIESRDYSIPISNKWEQYIDYYTGKITKEDLNFELPKTRQKLERIDSDANLFDCILQMRSSGIRALSIDKPLPTFAVSISGGGAMIPVYTGERRHMNLQEIKRIMGFPDNFNFPVSRTNAIKQLANAVCPPVITSIGDDILNQIFHL